jgi:predicted transcriptional regulator
MPRRRIQRFRQRALIARLFMEMLTTVSGQYSELTSYDDLLIGIAVALGQAEGRPMTTTKAAAFIGMPRTTVLRRVRVLVERGLLIEDPVTRHLQVPLERLNDESAVKMIARLEQLINSTAQALSKLDTKTIALLFLMPLI